MFIAMTSLTLRTDLGYPKQLCLSSLRLDPIEFIELHTPLDCDFQPLKTQSLKSMHIINASKYYD